MTVILCKDERSDEWHITQMCVYIYSGEMTGEGVWGVEGQCVKKKCSLNQYWILPDCST